MFSNIGQRLRLLVLAFALLMSSLAGLREANAYDKDTHFYEMYAMARYAGIGHEVAVQLAMYNEWIDVSPMSTPMGGPFIGAHLRRLFHFPGEFSVYKNSGGLITHGAKLNVLGVATRDNPFARELIMEGMKTGNLLLIGAGLHVHMDSFGHEGYGWWFGHGEGGHWPDRPWADLAKHAEMNKALFEDLVALRKLLPQSALDKEFGDGAGAKHFLLSADELAAKYKANEKIQTTLATDPFKTERYTRRALELILTRAKEVGIMTSEFDVQLAMSRPGLFTSGYYVKDILEILIGQLFAMDSAKFNSLVDMTKVGEVVLTGYPLHRISVQRIGFDRVEAQVVNKLLYGLIPDPLNDRMHVAFESEGELRKLEMQMRLGWWQTTIEQVTGAKIRFDAKKLIDRVKAQIAAWRGKSVAASLKTIDKTVEVINATRGQRFKFGWLMFKYAWWDGIVRLDALRLKASRDNMAIAFEEAFEEMIEDGTVKQVLSEEALAKLKERHEKWRRDNGLVTSAQARAEFQARIEAEEKAAEMKRISEKATVELNAKLAKIAQAEKAASEMEAARKPFGQIVGQLQAMSQSQGVSGEQASSQSTSTQVGPGLNAMAFRGANAGVSCQATFAF
jgi:hypothetical protein